MSAPAPDLPAEAARLLRALIVHMEQALDGTVSFQKIHFNTLFAWITEAEDAAVLVDQQVQRIQRLEEAGAAIERIDMAAATEMQRLKATVDQLSQQIAQQQEVCICAAVLTEEGLVIRGHRHHDAMRAASLAFCRPKRNDLDAQGFVTSLGRYVNREEGYRLQIAAGIGSKVPSGYRGEYLFSEDLY